MSDRCCFSAQRAVGYQTAVITWLSRRLKFETVRLFTAVDYFIVASQASSCRRCVRGETSGSGGTLDLMGARLPRRTAVGKRRGRHSATAAGHQALRLLDPTQVPRVDTLTAPSSSFPLSDLVPLPFTQRPQELIAADCTLR